MGVVDVIDSLNQPVQKLMDTISGAIGKVYEPHYKRKMAEAKAYEIEQIGNAIRNNCDMPIIYNIDGSLQVDTSNYEDLIKRTGARLAFQEIQKQENIESIVDNAYQLLAQETEVSDVPVDNGWMIRFINSVSDITDKDLQMLWSKILAGEIKNPNTFSLRSLEVLKNMTKYEAELFQKMAPFVTDGYIINDDEIETKYNFSYEDILKLDDCGLMNSDGKISRNIPLFDNRIIMCNKNYILLSNETNNIDKPIISLNVFLLTEAGNNILEMLDIDSNNDYFLDLCRYIKSKYPKYSLKIYKIKETQEDTFICFDEEIL